MVLYIKILPGGKFTSGFVNGPAEIYDSINKLIEKGFFIKSKLNDVAGIVIDYEHPDFVLLQLQGPFANDIANGSMTRITYNGPYTINEITSNNLTIPALQEQCTYSNGILTSIDSSNPININITYARHPTRDYFTNFVINVV